MLQQYSRQYGSSDLVSIYTGQLTSNSTTTNTNVWNKPKGVRLVTFIVVGGGGGGGAGGAGAVGTIRGGGAGGGSGACARVQIPAIMLPDVLYVTAGIGGNGGTGVANSNGNNGASGSNSYVCIRPNDALSGSVPIPVHTLIFAGGGGGGAGGATGAATAGTAGTTGSQTNMPLGFGIGTLGLVAGQAGGAGGNGTGTVAAITAWTAGPAICTGGAGGGGCTTVPATQTGANITIADTTLWPSVPGGTANNPGSNGINYGLFLNANSLDYMTSVFPLISSGGSGGGSTSTNGATGGRGACGGFGSGGGGGGGAAGTTVTGGDGGNGGAGLVIIVCTY